VVKTIDIEWPSGARQKLANVPVNQFVTIDEARGIVATSGPGK
jgi:hypothetical protein